jgi:hypothetical protein
MVMVGWHDRHRGAHPLDSPQYQVRGQAQQEEAYNHHHHHRLLVLLAQTTIITALIKIIPECIHFSILLSSVPTTLILILILLNKHLVHRLLEVLVLLRCGERLPLLVRRPIGILVLLV